MIYKQVSTTTAKDMAKINLMYAGIMGIDRAVMTKAQWEELLPLLPFKTDEIRERAGLKPKGAGS